MARAADHFSHGDIAAATGMQKRAVQQLFELSPGVLPPGNGVNTFKRVAFVAALVNGGMPLFAAGRIVRPLVELEYNRHDGEVPSGLEYMVRELPPVDRARIDGASDYHYHAALYRYRGRLIPDKEAAYYTVGAPVKGDALLSIVDGRFVYSATYEGLKTLNIWTGRPEAFSYVGEVIGAERGKEVVFTHVSETVSFDATADDYALAGVDLTAQARLRFERATAVLTVNASLAIRNAFDRLVDHRAVKRRRS
jgi:hypothetical protein